MAQMNFGGVTENIVTREEFPLEKAREVLKNETIAVIGYGVQGPGQSLNLRDNGFNVIVGQRKGGKTWEKAVADGWVPGETLFDIDEACQRGTIIQYLLSDAARCNSCSSEGVGDVSSYYVSRRSWVELFFCYLSGCDR